MAMRLWHLSCSISRYLCQALAPVYMYFKPYTMYSPRFHQFTTREMTRALLLSKASPSASESLKQPPSLPPQAAVVAVFFPGQPDQGLSSVKATLPLLAPPAHVALRLPVGHTALAARTHCSHRPLEMLIVAPSSTASSVNFAVPDCPVVDSGAPPHFVTDPAIPPQMASKATFSS